MSTFVSVGNATQPFGRMLDAIAGVLGELPQPVVVQRGHSRFDCAGCQVLDFVDMAAFERLVAESELVVLHAGAGSAIQAIHAGKVPVVIPRRADLAEHVDDHQLEFARELAQLGKVVLVTDTRELRQGIVTALELQRKGGAAVVPPPLVAMLRERLETYARNPGNRPAG